MGYIGYLRSNTSQTPVVTEQKSESQGVVFTTTTASTTVQTSQSTAEKLDDYGYSRDKGKFIWQNS